MKKLISLAMADKFTKDYINKGNTPYRQYIMTEDQVERFKCHLAMNTCKEPIPINGMLRFEQPSEEQKDLIEESKKKMDKIMDESMIHVNAALTEYVHQFKTYPNNIEIKLILDNEVVDKTTTHFIFSVQPILIPE